MRVMLRMLGLESVSAALGQRDVRHACNVKIPWPRPKQIPSEAVVQLHLHELEIAGPQLPAKRQPMALCSPDVKPTKLLSGFTTWPLPSQ